MEHRHPYTARGVLTALGKSALYVLFFLGVQLLTGAIYAAIAIAGSALRPGGFDPQSILNGADTATLLADFFVAAGLLLWFKIRQTPLSEAVCLRRCSGWTVGFCSFAGIVLYVLTDLALSLLPEAWLTAYNADMSVLTSTGLNTFLTMAVLGPLAEELTFRGVIQTRLERAMPPWLALVLQAAIFGLVHGTPIQMVYAFLMGLAFGFLRRRTGSILPGITRDSVLQICRDWGLPTEERRISVDELLEAQANGKLEEVFGTGTAAVISPVGKLRYKDDVMVIGDGKIGEISQKLYDTVTGIQLGKIEDKFGWRVKVD